MSNASFAPSPLPSTFARSNAAHAANSLPPITRDSPPPSAPSPQSTIEATNP